MADIPDRFKVEVSPWPEKDDGDPRNIRPMVKRARHETFVALPPQSSAHWWRVWGSEDSDTDKSGGLYALCPSERVARFLAQVLNLWTWTQQELPPQITEIQKIEVDPGDVLAVRLHSAPRRAEEGRWIKERLEALLGCTVMVYGPDPLTFTALKPGEKINVELEFKGDER